MVLDIIKKLNRITERDFISIDSDIKNLEEQIGVKFPDVLSDFYKKIGINSSLFTSVLSDLRVSKNEILEMQIDSQTGDKWGLNLKNNNLLYKTDKGEWTNVKYSVGEFLIDSMLKVSTYSQKYSAMGECSMEDIKIALDNGFLDKIEVEPIELKVSNIINLKSFYYQSCPNDIIQVSSEQIFCGANSKSDFEKLITSFEKNWYAPWMGVMG